SFYVLLIVLSATSRQWMVWKRLPTFVLWIAVPMLPYVFLTYSPYIPSRQAYMASMALAGVMAYLIRELKPMWIRATLVTAFIAYNIGYMWLRNDAQFESRAAPTSQLLTLLRSRQPAPILLVGFPYVVPDIAKD